MKIIISNNGWTTKISGGDVHIQKTANFWRVNHSIFWLIPKLGIQYSKNKIFDNFVISNTIFERESRFLLMILLLYTLRIVNSIIKIGELKGEIGIASSHFLYDVLPLLMIKLQNSNCILVVYFHGLPEASLKGKKWTFFRRINDFFSILMIKNKYDVIFVINSEMKKYLIKKGIDKNCIYITNNGIDVNHFIENSKPKSFEGCFLGRIVQTKGIFDLINIWKELIKEYQFKLVIIGDGPDMKLLQKLIKNYSLQDNIILTGHLDDERFSILAKSSIFLFPSYSESWGIAIAEALSMGIPVIAYDLSIYHEIFQDTLILVERGNTEMMRQQFLKLLFDEKLQCNLSIKGKNFIKRYNWHEIAQQELFIIENIKNQ